MQRLIASLACAIALAVPATASASGDFKTLRPGEIAGLHHAGCVGGFVAKTVPRDRSGFYRWDTPSRFLNASSAFALLDTNRDGIHDSTDGYYLRWEISGFDQLLVENAGGSGKVAVKIWRFC